MSAHDRATDKQIRAILLLMRKAGILKGARRPSPDPRILPLLPGRAFNGGPLRDVLHELNRAQASRVITALKPPEPGQEQDLVVTWGESGCIISGSPAVLNQLRILADPTGYEDVQVEADTWYVTFSACGFHTELPSWNEVADRLGVRVRIHDYGDYRKKELVLPRG